MLCQPPKQVDVDKQASSGELREDRARSGEVGADHLPTAQVDVGMRAAEHGVPIAHAAVVLGLGHPRALSGHEQRERRVRAEPDIVEAANHDARVPPPAVRALLVRDEEVPQTVEAVQLPERVVLSSILWVHSVGGADGQSWQSMRQPMAITCQSVWYCVGPMTGAKMVLPASLRPSHTMGEECRARRASRRPLARPCARRGGSSGCLGCCHAGLSVQLTKRGECVLRYVRLRTVTMLKGRQLCCVRLKARRMCGQ